MGSDGYQRQNPWNALRPSLYLTNDIGDGVLYLPVGATPEIIRTAVGMKDALGLPYGVNDYKILFYGNFDLNTAGIYQVSVRGIGVHGVRVEQEMSSLRGKVENDLKKLQIKENIIIETAV